MERTNAKAIQITKDQRGEGQKGDNRESRRYKSSVPQREGKGDNK